MRETRLPSGRAAFDPKERRHLASVRGYVLALYLIHAIGIVALVALVLARRTRAAVRDGLAAGALLTLAIAAFTAVYLAVSAGSYLSGFHRVFFSGSSWRFADTETLRRLFPDRFWSDTAFALAAGVTLQALALLALALAWRRQAIRPRGRRAAHARR